MKPGLLLKDAPEPTIFLECWTCHETFFSAYDWQQHRKIIHKEVYAYKKYVYSHLDEPSYYPRWVEISEWEGLMIAPWPVPNRPKRRWKVTKTDLDNRAHKKCHCGKPPKKPRRKYCSEECAEDWYSRITYVGDHRDNFVKKHGKFCDQCNKEISKLYDVQMDHIIALVLGGHPWDERNLQALCPECHKIKTAIDIKILSWWKQQIKYDTGPIVIEEQTMLEIYT